jgi:hypothetical protein
MHGALQAEKVAIAAARAEGCGGLGVCQQLPATTATFGHTLEEKRQQVLILLSTQGVRFQLFALFRNTQPPDCRHATSQSYWQLLAPGQQAANTVY